MDPVCGWDGKTYNNKCLADNAHVAVAYYGRCHRTNSDSEYYPEDEDFDSADYYPESEDYDFDYEDDDEEEPDDVDFSSNPIASE